MGPNDIRVSRDGKLRPGICPLASLLLGTWLLTAGTAQAESWVLHLPMVVGSVAPSPPVESEMPSTLDGTRHRVAMVGGGNDWSDPRLSRELHEPIAPLSWEFETNGGSAGSPRLESPYPQGIPAEGKSLVETLPPGMAPPGMAPPGMAPPGSVSSRDPGNHGALGDSTTPHLPLFQEGQGAPLSDWGYSPWDHYAGEGERPLEDFAELELMLQPTDEWTWQVMPIGLLYQSYLAGAKEPRFSSYLNRDTALGQIWDASLGGRLGILRYGTQDIIRPEGWQIDLEGASQARLDPIADSTPLLSVDFRVGIPITWAQGPWQFKTGYYHISAHLGDEFLLLFPDARRLNYTRDAVMLGVGYFWTESIRLYGEVAYAVSANDGAEPWEMQFGIDWVPAYDTGPRGAPFAAINGHLREEVNFGGNLVVQAGWAWRRQTRGSLFRTGIQYYRGKSDQYEYFDYSERRIGWGMWADF
jgi:hypothetical protein